MSRRNYKYRLCIPNTKKKHLPLRGNKKEKWKMSWIVTYGGWIIYEGDDEKKAYEEYRACGPYGKIKEVD